MKKINPPPPHPPLLLRTVRRFVNVTHARIYWRVALIQTDSGVRVSGIVVIVPPGNPRDRPRGVSPVCAGHGARRTGVCERRRREPGSVLSEDRTLRAGRTALLIVLVSPGRDAPGQCDQSEACQAGGQRLSVQDPPPPSLSSRLKAPSVSIYTLT
ncbi:unnamed protein product [Pleuronectes platessa]|uniref:Uncharacterized protein n=1 Tax=Pleuronectes platessa TaxID=8262 RepID=A0A9N7VLH9_PLEPL|nr:unnamed protein product [Pleuronectes platessa]